MEASPKLLGKKFRSTHVDRKERATAIQRGLDLLCQARLCHKVFATDIASASLGLLLHEMHSLHDLSMVNEGAMAEQLIGQLLRTLEPKFMDSMLYYWSREKKASKAEIDYLIQQRTHVVPIEVKAGTTGILKSLHHFMALRNFSLAVRFNADLPSVTHVDTTTTTGEKAVYRLLSLPFYLAE